MKKATTKKIKPRMIEVKNILCMLDDYYLYEYLIAQLEHDIGWDEGEIDGLHCDINIREPGYRYQNVDTRRAIRKVEKQRDLKVKALKTLNETVKLLKKADEVEV